MSPVTTKKEIKNYDYRDFVRDENGKLVHKSKIKSNSNEKIKLLKKKETKRKINNE